MGVVPLDFEVDRVEIEAVRWVAALTGLAGLACGEGEEDRVADLCGDCAPGADFADVAGAWVWLIMTLIV